MTPDYQTLRSIFSAALRNGAERISLFECEWDLAGDCERPQYVSHYAAPDPERGKRHKVAIGVDAWGDTLYHPTKLRQKRSKYFIASRKTGNPLHVVMWTRCRNCGRCLRYKQRRWADRALLETKYAVRTWFITLTVDPARAYLSAAEGRQYLRRKAATDPSPRELFAAHCRQIGLELTRYIKRLRKETRADIRYIAVFEAHKSGVPHIHMLLHEANPVRSVTKRQIQGQWTYGYSHCKLVPMEDPRAARYACKYLGKDVAARVRASRHYGNAEKATERWQAHVLHRGQWEKHASPVINRPLHADEILSISRMGNDYNFGSGAPKTGAELASPLESTKGPSPAAPAIGSDRACRLNGEEHGLSGSLSEKCLEQSGAFKRDADQNRSAYVPRDGERSSDRNTAQRTCASERQQPAGENHQISQEKAASARRRVKSFKEAVRLHWPEPSRAAD